MITEKDFLTGKEVLYRVALHGGFKISYFKKYTDIAVSDTIHAFNINPTDNGLISALKNSRFAFDESPERRAFYIALDDNAKYPDNPSEGIYSSQSFCWAKDQKPPYVLEAKVDVALSEKKRGAVLTAHMDAPSGTSTYLPTHNKLLKVLIDYFKPEGSLLTNLVADNFETVIGWSDIRLGGLRSLSAVFAEFAVSEKIKNLARSSLSPFSPEPFKQTFDSPRYYVPENIQFRLFYQWDQQLTGFRESLKRG